MRKKAAKSYNFTNHYTFLYFYICDKNINHFFLRTCFFCYKDNLKFWGCIFLLTKRHILFFYYKNVPNFQIWHVFVDDKQCLTSVFQNPKQFITSNFLFYFLKINIVAFFFFHLNGLLPVFVGLCSVAVLLCIWVVGIAHVVHKLVPHAFVFGRVHLFVDAPKWHCNANYKNG